MNKSVKRIRTNIDKVVRKVSKCVSYEMLYCLEEDFNGIGMTLQPAKKDRMILCTMTDGVPTAKRIFEDYIHIGSLENGPGEVPMRLIECIKDFVHENARLPSMPLNRASNWQTARNSLYGEYVADDAIKGILENVHDDPTIKPKKPTESKKTISEGLDPSKIAKNIVD